MSNEKCDRCENSLQGCPGQVGVHGTWPGTHIFKRRSEAPRPQDSSGSAGFELLSAVLRLKRATHEAERCATLLLSDGESPEAAEKMREYTAATKDLFDMVGT